jgi:hypothetical protein
MASPSPTPTTSAATKKPSATTGTSQVQRGIFVFNPDRIFKPLGFVSLESSSACNASVESHEGVIPQ